MAKSASANDEGKGERLMKVVRVRTGNEHAEIMFVESARIYRLSRLNPAFEEALQQLRAAEGSGRAVRVRFNQPNGAIIEGVSNDEGR